MRQKTGKRWWCNDILYVKEKFNCTKIKNLSDSLECVGITIRLSPEMSLVIVLYRPSSAKDFFFTYLTEILKKKCNNRETILLGDFISNWLDKNKSQK